jgi:hypothetical protein
MTATINYDRPVKNLIDQLSATGHVTHTKYKKKSVTFHHNGGRLSHEGVLSVWKTRPASAHFDSDAFGRLAQYVEVHEYAWAVANTRGNQETISIEMCNSTLGPNWEVADPTWQEAARLAGWLFVHVIGTKRRAEATCSSTTTGTRPRVLVRTWTRSTTSCCRRSRLLTTTSRVSRHRPRIPARSARFSRFSRSSRLLLTTTGVRPPMLGRCSFARPRAHTRDTHTTPPVHLTLMWFSEWSERLLTGSGDGTHRVLWSPGSRAFSIFLASVPTALGVREQTMRSSRCGSAL